MTTAPAPGVILRESFGVGSGQRPNGDKGVMRDAPLHTSYPTALMAFSPPAFGYEVSMEGWPSPIAGACVAIGFTSSSVLTSNLTSVGSLWLRVRDLHEPGLYNYELRTGGMTGAVLASGTMGLSGFSRWAIRYAPSTSAVTLAIDGEVVGSFHATIPSPRYVAVEGVGILDDFVVRQ